MKAPKTSAELCYLLLKYEVRHYTDRGEVTGNPEQRGTRSNGFN